MHEAKMHPDNSFITLTFKDEHLPWDRSVTVEHMQDFMKDLRHSVYPRKIKSLYCGEYGKKLYRPHYHAVLFNHDFHDKKFYKKNENGDQLFTSEKLSALWPFGHCTVGAVSWQSAAYVAKYTLKKLTGPEAEHHYQWYSELTGSWIRVQPEFAKMSNGIGQEWLRKYWSTDCFNHGFVVAEGKKRNIPRYYYKKIKEFVEKGEVSEEDVNRMLREIKRNTVVAGIRNKHDRTSRRLRVREEVKTAAVGRYERELD